MAQFELQLLAGMTASTRAFLMQEMLEYSCGADFPHISNTLPSRTLTNIRAFIGAPLKSNSPASAANLVGAIGLLIGLAFVPFALLGALFTRLGAEMIGVTLLWSLLYGMGGYVGGGLVALAYNLVASRLGGLQVHLETPSRPIATPESVRSTRAV